ncbi:MAG: type IX secretion system membrane protein PorP/SprF [Bacteroidales bacterium]|nr:type IX secretion system membrane protein PorP/SprF [Bacteroidales bacterium]
MRTLKTIISIYFVGLSAMLYAQQIPTLSQYMENNYLLNPGAAGTNSSNPISFHYKKWWSGFSESPTMQSITAHYSLTPSVGLGGKIFNYSLGPLSKLGIEGTYAYHFKVTENSKLSLGLSAQLYQFYINKNLLKLEEENDAAIVYSSDKIIVPDAAFGIYYYHEKYFAGISVYQLFNRKVHMMNNNYLENRQIRHYFLTAGYRFDINNNISLEPSFLIKLIEKGIGQADVNLRTIFNELLWAGFSYRTSESLVLNAGIKRERFALGYAYDWPLSDIKQHSLGSHELYFSFFFNKSKTKLVTP